DDVDISNEVIPDTSSSDEEDGELGPRIRKTPGKFKDFVTGKRMQEAIEAEEALHNALHNLAVFVSGDDPKTFEEAQKLDVWRK
ncbi:hypothetical protein A2U01_0088098, partial [Trifolium medium]|nr:hypothetical protein [Trifolium medium]